MVFLLGSNRLLVLWLSWCVTKPLLLTVTARASLTATKLLLCVTALSLASLSTSFVLLRNISVLL